MNYSTTTKKIAKNTIYQLLGKVVSTAVTITTTILVTRIYGKASYGEFSLMQSYPALFFIIVDFGLNAVVVREITKKIEDSQKYLSNLLSIRLILSAFFIMGVSIVMIFMPYDFNLKLGICLSLFLILTQALYSTTNTVFQSRLRYDLATISYVISSFSILALVLLFSLLKANVVLVSFSYVIGGFVLFLINARFLKNFGLNLSLSFDKDLWKFLFLQSLPLGLMFIFSQINFKSDAILLSFMKLPPWLNVTNKEAVAVYNLPYKIFEVALVIPTFFMNATYPIFVRHFSEGKDKLKESFFLSLKYLFVGGVLFGFLGYIFAPVIIKILGGAQFTESIRVLRILIFFIFVFYLTQPISWLIVTLNQQKKLPKIYFLSAIFNLGMNLYFIPLYGFYASAVITIASELLILICLAFVAKSSWREVHAN